MNNNLFFKINFPCGLNYIHKKVSVLLVNEYAKSAALIGVALFSILFSVSANGVDLVVSEHWLVDGWLAGALLGLLFGASIGYLLGGLVSFLLQLSQVLLSKISLGSHRFIA